MIMCVRHLAVGAVGSLCEVGLEPPVTDGGLDVLPLYVQLLRSEFQRQSMDGFGVHWAGARESSADAADVCAREGRFYILRYCVHAHPHPSVDYFPGPACLRLQG